MEKGTNEPEGRNPGDTSKTARQWTLLDGQGHQPTAGKAGLIRFDRSRRRFLKLGGLTLAGLFMPFPQGAAAGGDLVSMRVDRAIAMALQDAGVQVVTHVPATGATAIFDNYHALVGSAPDYAFNEELAYTMAHSAALSGARSASIIKSHGLAKAANSVIDSLTIGTTAGFVAVVLDDPSGSHSDNIFGLEDFMKGTGIPFKKAGIDTAYSDLIECFLWSEELRTPVALFIDANLMSIETRCKRSILRPSQAKYQRDPLRHVLCPPLAPYQRKVLDARLTGADWRAIPVPAMPQVPSGLPPAWRSAVYPLIPLFEVFQELRPKIAFASGDTGLSALFALPPFNCIDACSYYGGSLPLAIGFHLGGFGRSWAITGDYAFIAAGHMGLIEALARQVPLKVLLIHNGCAAATGGQPIPDRIFEQVLAGWAPFVTRLDNPQDKAEVKKTLTQAIESDRLEIMVARFRA
jgi:TPP-dependent indolepyruvate ferredoxin oxidoreductase alpha subunit